MPPLQNHRHEAFAQALAKGMPANRAYVEAGYVYSEPNASKLTRNAKVKARLQEFIDAAAKRATVTRASLIEECQKICELAVRDGQYSAAVSAVREMGVLSGERVERTEFGRPGEFADMSDRELAQALIEEQKRLKLLPAPPSE